MLVGKKFTLNMFDSIIDSLQGEIEQLKQDNFELKQQISSQQGQDIIQQTPNSRTKNVEDRQSVQSYNQVGQSPQTLPTSSKKEQLNIQSLQIENLKLKEQVQQLTQQLLEKKKNSSVQEDQTSSSNVQQKMKSIFDRLGGQEAINQAVDVFYDRMLIDLRTKKFFDKTDMKIQRQAQKDFMTQVFGGPQVYKGKNMKEAHKHLKLYDNEFDATVEILVGVLRDFNIDEETIQDIGALLETTRNDILNKPIKSLPSLYEQLGGAEGIDVVIDQFYDKMLSDDRVSNYFVSTNMKNLRSMQKKFMAQVLGGPQVYDGKNMLDAHKSYKISSDVFDYTVENLVSVLQELGVESDLIQQVGTILETTRKDVCVNE